MGIFKAYDIRGVYPTELHEEMAYAVGCAAATFFGSKEIIVGRDMRESSDTLFTSLTEGALTMQQGGGIGYDFSTLRPQGTPTLASGAIASGPVSFMRIWDAMCATMLSTGARRGAMMATLRCDHPDIETFIDAKRDPVELRHFNLSVQVTDEFMSAVESRSEWPLVFPVESGLPVPPGALVRRPWTGAREPRDCRVIRVVRADELWERILRTAYDTAEPGVLFIDRINRENNLREHEYLTATNPCGEIPLPPYGACDLGSLNLTAFVLEPFSPAARLDFDRLRSAAGLAVRFLDNIIEISGLPLVQQADAVRSTRRIGLGLTGLADALAMLGQRYDGWTARGVAEDVMRTICVAAYRASAELAREKGVFPAFRPEEYLASPFVRRLPVAVRARIAADGMRNSHLLAIAPAGTISLLAGNISSGIEPIFALEAQRRVLGADGAYTRHHLRNRAWDIWLRCFPGEPPPDTLREAAQVSPGSQLEMQAALQPWVDNAISKTINVAAYIGFDSFRALYGLAYRRGLKGCTVFRPNAIRGEILTPSTTPRQGSCCDIEREAD